MQNFTRDALTYVLLVIPSLFSLAVIGQGITKLEVKPTQGKVEIGFGILFMVLVVLTYIFFVR